MKKASHNDQLQTFRNQINHLKHDAFFSFSFYGVYVAYGQNASRYNSGDYVGGYAYEGNVHDVDDSRFDEIAVDTFCP